MSVQRDAPGLALGPQVRSRRAALRRQLAAGTADLAALVEGQGAEADEALALGMTIAALLSAAPATRDLAIQIAVAAELVNLNIRLGEMTTARRAALAEAIRKETPS